MVAEIAGFTVVMVLVLGGVCGAIIKYTIHGKVTANVSHRINDGLWKEAMEQSHLEDAMEMSETDAKRGAGKEQKRQQHKQGGMKMRHVTA